MIDISKLQEGKETDALIATHIFGFFQAPWRGEEGHWWGKSPGDPEQNIYAEALLPIRLPGSSVDSHDGLPRFSSDIAAAMSLFQHLRESGKWCCLKIEADYNFVWDVKLTPAQDDPDDGEYVHEPTIIIGGQGELPLAICKAAILAEEGIA